MLTHRNVVILTLALVFVSLSVSACSRNKLSRARAAELIKPQVSGEMAVAVPTIEYNLLYKGYFDPLIEKGIVKLSKQERIEHTDFAKPFVKNIPDDSRTQGWRTALVLADRAFQEVTGVSESDNGKSAAVEFTWFWKPTAAGERLQGVVLKSPIIETPISIPTLGLSGTFPYKATAKCDLYDDGWRCQADVPSSAKILNQYLTFF